MSCANVAGIFFIVIELSCCETSVVVANQAIFSNMVGVELKSKLDVFGNCIQCSPAR